MGFDLDYDFGGRSEKSVSPAYYLDLGDVKGDAVHKTYKDQILISAFKFEQSQQKDTTGEDGSGGDKKSTTVTHDMTFVAPMSSASPLLMQSSATGKHFKTATLTVLDSASKEVISTFELTDVYISSYQVGGNSTGHPLDKFSLNFVKIDTRWTGPKPDGSKGKPTSGGYNLGKITQ